MDLNFLQRLGLLSPGPGVSAPAPDMGGYTQPYASEPVAPTPPPVNLLEGISGYGAASGPPAAPQPPVAAAPAQPPANMLQNLNPGAPVDAAPAVADTATRPARARSSVVDTLGRLADVFAQVGGANALYQPTLDARQNREISLGDHDRTVAMDKIKLADATGDLGDKGNARLGQAIRGLQAIQAANPQADISKIWPMLAQQAGVDPARAAALGAQIQANPELLKGLAGTVGATKEFGLQPFYATDKDGKITAYQMSKDGTIQPIVLPDGVTASDPTKAVNLGDRTALVGTRSGRVTDTLANGEKPGGAADRAARVGIAAGNNRTAITVAGMPARAKPGAAAPGGQTQAARDAVGTTLDELSGIYGKLNKMGAIVSPNRSAGGNVLSYLRSSGAGQVVEGALGTEAQTLRDRVASIRPGLMQQLAKATGMTGKQLDSNADVKLFMQTVTNPQSSYEANQAAIAGLRRLLASAPQPTSGGGGGSSLPPRLGAPKPAPRPAPRPAAKPGAGAGGWKIVGVK